MYLSNWNMTKNVSKICLPLKKLWILGFDQKLPSKPKKCKNTSTVSEKLLLKKSSRKQFFIIKASRGSGENFIHIGNDFGAGL
jgi:hypothetical protein